MKMLDLSVVRTTYQVSIQTSLLWEAALGLAAVTYEEIRESLERSPVEWEDLVGQLSDDLQQELKYCTKTNSWQALLRLIHASNVSKLDDFITYLRDLPDEELRYQILPPLGEPSEQVRRFAVAGDLEAISAIRDAAKGHGFLFSYVSFMLDEKVERLREHFIVLMKNWYDVAIAPHEEEYLTILRRDETTIKERMARLSVDELLEEVLGTPYTPELGIREVMLIPHICYRPWTIQADLTDTKIFYYPVGDDSLYEGIDPYRPAASLVLLYHALGDENRLRIMKLLYMRDRTLQELTKTMNLAKSTIHHHLSLLRSVGLVRATGSTYQLRSQKLEQVGKQLQVFLEQH